MSKIDEQLPLFGDDVEVFMSRRLVALRRAVIAVALVCVLAPPIAQGQSCQAADGYWAEADSDPELKRMMTTLMELMACQGDAKPVELTQLNDTTACNWFLAKSLERLYKVKDFVPRGTDEWLNANQIADYVAASPEWSLLGRANDARVLADAANGARVGQPVIAVWKNLTGDHGHVALILPGNVKASSNWGMSVPNSASFFLDSEKRVRRAYVGCRLSAAFGQEKAADVSIYWRLKK